MLKTPLLKTTALQIPLGDLRPAPWNYKPAGTQAQRRKLVESIRRDGSAGVLAVRELTEGGATVYEVIDGNHRLSALLDLAETEEEWESVFCENFGILSLAAAVTIARRRNEQWYEPDGDAYARLLVEVVVPEIGMEELIDFMPEGAEDLAGLYDHGLMLLYGPDEAAPPLAAPSPFLTLILRMPREAYPVYEAAYARLAALLRADGTPLHPDPKIAAGQAVELLAADYLGR